MGLETEASRGASAVVARSAIKEESIRYLPEEAELRGNLRETQPGSRVAHPKHEPVRPPALHTALHTMSSPHLRPQSFLRGNPAGGKVSLAKHSLDCLMGSSRWGSGERQAGSSPPQRLGELRVAANSGALESNEPGFKFQHHLLIALCLWITSVLSLSLSFLISKVGTMSPTLQDCLEN